MPDPQILAMGGYPDDVLLNHALDLARGDPAFLGMIEKTFQAAARAQRICDAVAVEIQ